MRPEFVTKTYLYLLFIALTSVCFAEDKTPLNLIENGGFEKAITGWHWEEWKGYKVPGFVDREDMNEGAVSFKLTVPGLHERRQIGRSFTGIKPGMDYTVKIDLMCRDLAKDGAMVRMLMFVTDQADGKSRPGGWIEVPAKSGVNELIKLSGTEDWKTYTVEISKEAIDENVKNVWIMVDHKDVGSGVVGVDNIRVFEKQPEQKSDQSQAKKSSVTTYTYDIADPTVLVPVENAKVQLELSPDQTFYRVGNLPQIKLQSQAVTHATLSLKIKNGFGDVVFEKVDMSMDSALSQDVKLPGDRGYFEIIATVTSDGKEIAQTRRSLGLLMPPPPTDTDEPWGYWCNGSSDFRELGVRWTRPALYWYYYNKDAKGYMQKTIKMIDENHAKGIKVLMYPKDHPSHHAITQKVFEDTPEAWAEVRAYWTYIVKALGSKVDAWGLINEPYRGMWAGTDDLILRYWKMMHEIVKEHAPGVPLIGPSLNINEPSMMAQYTELLQSGLGQSIDGLELHTYTATAMPEDIGWENNINAVRKLTREYTGDKPIYSTEMGITMGYENELYQAQYLARCFVWAKKMKLKMLLWHMYSWPDGTPLSERNFGNFRGDPKKVQTYQPRPAGVAYGAMTRQLTGATYRTQLDYLGPAVKAFVFEKQGQAVLAIWRIDTRQSNVDLAVANSSVQVTNLFGQVRSLSASNGIVTLPVSSSMQFVTGIGEDYLNVKPLIQTPPTLALQAGGDGQSQLTLTNPGKESATVTLKWLTPENWQVHSPEQSIKLKPHQTKSIHVTVTCPANAAYEQSVLYARAKLDGKVVSPARLPVRVEPRVVIDQVKPIFDSDNKPAVQLSLKRSEQTLNEVQVHMGEVHTVVALDGNHKTVQIPVNSNDTQTALHDYQINLHDGQRQQDQQTHALSFVATAHVNQPPAIDGDLSEWSSLPTPTASQPVVAWRWDESNLYLAVKAADAIHIQDQRPETLWRQDNIQVGISCFESNDWVRKPIGEMRESSYTELSIGAHATGPALAYCHATMNRQTCPMGQVRADQMPAAVQIADGITSYEIAIPTNLLGLKPLKLGTLVKASVLLNTNDGGRRGYIEWFSGIAQTKTPQHYAHLILTP